MLHILTNKDILYTIWNQVIGKKWKPFCEWTNGDLSIQNGYEDMILHKKMKYSKLCTEYASKIGNLNILHLLHHTYHINLSSNCMNTAANNGHTHILQYLHKHGCKFEECAMDMAAASGFLETVQWLHEHDGKCTTNAMDFAAINGYINIVQWLHEHRTEGCHYAMMFAAVTGKLEILKWFHENKYSCTHDIINNAAINGQEYVLEWLLKNRNEEFGKAALEWSAYYGYLRIIHLLCQYRHRCRNFDDCIHVAMETAIRKKQSTVEQWLSKWMSENG